jgi:hypothetical protein
MQQLRLFLIPTGKLPYMNSLILSGKTIQFRGGDNATLLWLFNAENEHLKDGEKVVVPYGVANQPLNVGDMYLNIREKRVGKVMAGQEMGYQDWKIILQPSDFDNTALVKMYNDIKDEFWFTIPELGTKEVKTALRKESDAEKKKEKTNKPDNTDVQIGIEKKTLIRAWEDNPSARKVLETLYPSVFKPLVSGNVLEVIQKGESRFLLIAEIKKLVMTRGEEAHVQLIQLEKGQNVVAHHVVKQPLKRDELVTVLTRQNYFDNNHPHELVVHESIADVFDKMRNVGASEVKQRIVELSEPIDETRR